MFNEHKGSVCDDEKVLEMIKVKYIHYAINVLICHGIIYSKMVKMIHFMLYMPFFF